MPLPPDEITDTENGENGENGSKEATPTLQFSYVECLLFTLHQLARKSPEFLFAADDSEVTERMKDFKIRYLMIPTHVIL